MLHLIPRALLLAALAVTVVPMARAQDATVYFFRYIEVAPAAQQKVPAMLKSLADASRKEAGAVRFEVLQRASPANQFVTVEAWKDKAALDAHNGADHTKKFMTQIEPLMVAPLDERPCDALDVSAPAQGREPRGRIFVVTHVDVNPPNKDKAFEALKAFAAASRKEDGSLRFDVMVQQVRNQNHFQVVEVWRDQKANDAHETSASTKDFRAKIGPLSGALYDHRWYRPL
jgi:quinol monooxygenase YgiN